MLEKIYTIASNELRTLIREKTFILLLSVFFAMTFFSVYIGWSTKTTSLGIYQDTVRALQQAGTVYYPPNPFLNIPPLAIFSNMIIYVFLIGSLLAIVIGNRSFIRERKSGVMPLISVSTVGHKTYIFGKIAGIIASLALILIGTYLISILSTFLIPNQHITILEALRLILFYATAFVYMLIFAMVSLFFSIFVATESLALLIPIIIWVIAVFILPELTTGQNPVALLNPINIAQALPAQGPFFSFMRLVLTPISIGQHFTATSLDFLEAHGPNGILSIRQSLVKNFWQEFSLILYFLVFSGASILAMIKYSSAKDKIT